MTDSKHLLEYFVPMISVMFWSRSHAALRRGACALAIAFFLGGANFCTLSALQGAPMACLGVKGKTAAKVSHCCHAAVDESASADAGHGTQGGSAPAPSSCCLHVAIAVAPQLDKADAGVTPVVVPAAADPIPGAPSITSRHLDLARDESPPPRPDLRVAPPGRAPPLA